jgi:hypothetical protein
MNDLDPAILFGNHTQVDNPDVSQASGNEQAGQTEWVRDVTFVQVETSAFLVREGNCSARWDSTGLKERWIEGFTIQSHL